MDGLGVLKVCLLLQLLLEERVGLGLLDADAAGAEAAEVAGRVRLVHARAQFVVIRDQSHACGVRRQGLVSGGRTLDQVSFTGVILGHGHIQCINVDRRDVIETIPRWS